MLGLNMLDKKFSYCFPYFELFQWAYSFSGGLKKRIKLYKMIYALYWFIALFLPFHLQQIYMITIGTGFPVGQVILWLFPDLSLT